MSKKDFKSGLNILLGEDKAEEITRRGITKRGVTKTSQIGTKPGETRATFIINEDTLENLKALAWYERKTIKQVLNEALEGYIKKNKNIKEAKNLYKNKGGRRNE